MKKVIFLLAGLIFLEGCATVSKEQFLKNQQIRIAIFPLQNDFYGATETVVQKYLEMGYTIVEREKLYKVLEEMKIQMAGLTEYDSVKAGRILNVDYIVLGSAYTKVKHYDPENKVKGYNTKTAVLAGIVEGLDKASSGTFVHAIVRWVKVETGEVVKTEDLRIRKISD